MTNRVDFSDRGLMNVYQDVAENNVHALEIFLDAMEAICRKRAYKPLVDFTNSVIEFYEDEFRSHVMSCFESWRESEFSLDRLAISCGAGSGAANTGRQYMEELHSNLSGMFRRSFSRVSVDTDLPILEDKDILEANEEINSFIRRADSVGEEAVSHCNSRADQNMLYLLIEPVIKNTAESICECFRSMIQKVLEGSELYAMGVKSTIDSVRVGTKLEQAGFSWPAYDDFI